MRELGGHREGVRRWVVGCGGGEDIPANFKTTVEVTYKGAPVDNAMVTLRPDGHEAPSATGVTGADGKVYVSDILESSDAYRRGLRYDDEIVSLADRPVRTVNALKNVLGILPAGWRVPLVFRREGRAEEIKVRLAAVHAAAELAEIASGQRSSGPPSGPPGEGAPLEETGPVAKLPESVRDLYDPKIGFTNYHFSGLERDRVATAMEQLVGDDDLASRYRLQLRQGCQQVGIIAQNGADGGTGFCRRYRYFLRECGCSGFWPDFHAHYWCEQPYPQCFQTYRHTHQHFVLPSGSAGSTRTAPKSRGSSRQGRT